MSQGVPIQRIGLQCHTDDSPIFRNVFDAAALYDIFDTYAEFGLSLVLSEVSVPSRFAGENREDFQAKAAQMLYKVCFSHPGVNGIFWWNLTDDGILTTKRKAAGENLPSQGLLGENFREKEAYREIDRLINREWRTDVTGVTDPNEQVSFHGYNGTYEWQAADQTGELHFSSETGKTRQTVAN